MMITYESRFLTRAEVWYDNEPDDTVGVDWILYQQRSRPVPGTEAKFFHSYIIDLRQSREQLQANLSKDTAYKIRRARERDKIRCDSCDAREPAVMDEFEEKYNEFAKCKGLAPLQRRRLESMAAAGVLELTVARDLEGNILVYHANYRDRQRATGLELVSLYRTVADSAERNVVGRANRYLTWSDMMRYQEQGLNCFDFGGWYYGTDPAMQRINDFKRGFGGEVRREYWCETVLTLKGRVVLAVAGVLNWARRLHRTSGRNTPKGATEVDSIPSIAPVDAG